MRTRVIARKTHKWLGLLVGLQVVIWSLTGLYMTAIHLDIIHGDHLIREAHPKPADVSQLRDPVAVAANYGGEGARLTWVRNRPAYIVTTPTGEKVVDAVSGRPVAPANEAEIRSNAESTYTGNKAIASVALITEIPGEIRGRTPPLWRVEFDHWNKPTLYFLPTTGELVTRRHELWRIFDFFWMLHVMGYEDRDNVNNPLIRVFTWGALLVVLSGAWLLLYSFHRKKKAARA
ncbi:PepSY domain-containing protein [Sphingomonas sp.]|uniref:PepSY domain-containing protein n=1 Tax=Sphingomonas sp. TaxID=28214 RepID=UPI0017FFBB57|nr:PepSY domain-containing protein [Sphingomonas sp.]MBA3511261.1 PepSY domain-containing protein [Sphingomonas sp.]